MSVEGAPYLSEGIGPLIFNQSLSDYYFRLGPTLHWGSHLQPKIALVRHSYELLADVVGKFIAPIDVSALFVEFGYTLDFMTKEH